MIGYQEHREGKKLARSVPFFRGSIFCAEDLVTTFHENRVHMKMATTMRENTQHEKKHKVPRIRESARENIYKMIYLYFFSS